MEYKSHYIIRFNDCDPFNCLNNSRYSDYLLKARDDHLTEYLNWDFGDIINKSQLDSFIT